MHAIDLSQLDEIRTDRYEQTVPNGPSELRAWIERKLGGNIAKFAARAGLERAHASKIARGLMPRISADTALRIEEATGGDVPVQSWRLP